VVGDTPADKDQVLYLPGPFEGLLNVAAKSIRAAVDLEASMAGRARTPSPAIVLKEKEDNGMDQAEATKYVKAISQARRDPDGAVMFVPYSLDVTFEGDTASDLMIEARNAVKLDVANFLNLPSSLLDAALPNGVTELPNPRGQRKGSHRPAPLLDRADGVSPKHGRRDRSRPSYPVRVRCKP